MNKVAIYGKGKKCSSNVKTNFSDSKMWPGKLKVEMKYNPTLELNTIENTGVYLSILGIF